MIRNCMLLLAGMVLFYQGRAQAVQQVVSAGGGSKTLGSYTIDFTIGETVILSAGTDPSCTEGFQQPLTVRDLPDSNIGAAGWYIKVYPNPVHGQLTIHGYMDRAGELDFRVVDMLGRVLMVSPMAFLQGYNDASLDLGALAHGVYVLVITDKVHGGHQVIKLLKK